MGAETPGSTLLDEFMPRWHFNEVHSTVVHADANQIYRALKELPPSEIGVAQTLFMLRSLPSRLMGGETPSFAGNEPLLDRMTRRNFTLLGERPGEELAIGFIGQFWRPGGTTFHPLGGKDDFLAFDRADYGRGVTNFSIGPADDAGRREFRTETRVLVPDPAARRKFGAYWRIAGVGSGMLRRAWLSAVKRRAEAAAS